MNNRLNRFTFEVEIFDFNVVHIRSTSRFQFSDELLSFSGVAEWQSFIWVDHFEFFFVNMGTRSREVDLPRERNFRRKSVIRQFLHRFGFAYVLLSICTKPGRKLNEVVCSKYCAIVNDSNPRDHICSGTTPRVRFCGWQQISQCHKGREITWFWWGTSRTLTYNVIQSIVV